MEIVEFDNLLTRLEKEASICLKGKMQPFQQGEFACPWLRWWRGETKEDTIKIDGIFIMQDWWADDKKPLCEQIDYIINNQQSKYKGDRTIYRLYKSSTWKNAIWEKKNWLVTNAVWGARMCPNTSGPLPAGTHKAAFAVWSQLIKSFAVNDDFKVIFAGAWSSYKKENVVGI